MSIMTYVPISMLNLNKPTISIMRNFKAFYVSIRNRINAFANLPIGTEIQPKVKMMGPHHTKSSRNIGANIHGLAVVLGIGLPLNMRKAAENEEDSIGKSFVHMIA